LEALLEGRASFLFGQRSNGLGKHAGQRRIIMRSVTSLEEPIDGFRLYSLAEGKAPKTIGWYIQKPVYLRQYLEDEGLPTDVTQITINHLRTFIVHLQTEVRLGQNNPYRPAIDKPLSPRTVAGYARAFKLFFNQKPHHLRERIGKIIVFLFPHWLHCTMKAQDILASASGDFQGVKRLAGTTCLLPLKNGSWTIW
jgi:hypothetical protein